MRLIDVFEDARHVYIVTELLRGGVDLFLHAFHHCTAGELFERIKRQTSFSEQQARAIFRQIAEAVAFLHARHIAHRDLKAENLIFETAAADSDLKLVDFGFATEFQDSTGLRTPAGTVGCGD